MNTEDKIQDGTSDINSKKTTPAPVAGANPTVPANRGKKRKRPVRDATAPKQPLTGYFRLQISFIILDLDK